MMIDRAHEADRAAINELLAASDLPLLDRDLALEENPFFVARDPDLRGCAGLQVAGDVALLRSVAVLSGERGTGLGQALVEAALAEAARRGVRSVWLLTTTAAGYFPRFGFTAVPRDSAPGAVRKTSEYCGLCPASAVLMRRDLPPFYASGNR